MGRRRIRWAAAIAAGSAAMALASYAWAGGEIRLVVNGRAVTPDVPPQLVQGRLLVPLRAVAEALGAEVAWDEASRTVRVELGLRQRLAALEQESARLQAENARLQAENDRLQAENDRLQAENTRLQAEHARQQAENARPEVPGLSARLVADGRGGTLVILRNDGAAPVRDVRALLTGRGEVGFTGILGPGQQAVLRGPAAGASLALAQVTARPADAPPPALVPVGAPEVARDPDGRTRVVGRLRSQDPRTFRFHRVYVALWDREGRLLDAQQASFAFELKPGGEIFYYVFSEAPLPPPDQLQITTHVDSEP